MNEVKININDIKKAVYFIANLTQMQGDRPMQGALTSKADYMGGIFDRWINIIPESVLFNKIILPRVFENEKVDLIEIETADYNLRAQHCFKRLGMEECEKLHSLEGIVGYGLGDNDAPKIFMRLPKEKYFAELAAVNGILPKEQLPSSKEARDIKAP